MNHPESKVREVILDLLQKRRAGSTICPSEAARVAFPNDWRSQMDFTRNVARSMSKEGRIEVCQKGQPIDPESEFRGPIRLRLIVLDFKQE